MRSILLVLFLVVPWHAGRHVAGRYYASTVLHGIDVSHYQKYINWELVLGDRLLDFAFVKATEGVDFRDSLFSRNWTALDLVGIRRGAYHFFRPGSSGYGQAIHYLNTVDFKPGDLVPVLDVETTDQVSTAEFRYEIRRWLETVEAYLSRKPIIYSNQKFYERYLAGHFDDYPLWVARYSDKHPELSTRFWDFWQYSNTGALQGIGEPVDLNFFIGTIEMLERHCMYPAQTDSAHTPP